MVSFSGPEDDELERLQNLRQDGPDPEDYYINDKGEIDWDTYEKDYDDWAEETDFPVR